MENRKAWEVAREMLCRGIPGDFEEDNEQVWIEQSSGPELAQDEQLKMLWFSRVPGSGAEESICLSAIQATENRGNTVPNGMELYRKGLVALEQGDVVELYRITHDLFQACMFSIPDGEIPIGRSNNYLTFDEYAKAVKLMKKKKLSRSGGRKNSSESEQNSKSLETEEKVEPLECRLKISRETLLDKFYAGWLAQIIGGAYGTCMEGYCTDAILEKYGEVRTYLRKPNTYNDDITYELALLAAFERCGKNTDEKAISMEWISRIPTGWSAEAIALNNLRAGMPAPMSGSFNNPFYEWIGAQMRGAICGQLYPGNPLAAAKCAWMDASISHAGNGILGEIFNAVLVSMAFVEKDTIKLLEQGIALIPDDSEYGMVIRFAYDTCKSQDNYLKAWRICEEKYQKYNWIHAYPNAAIEVIALYFGNGDFEETLMICGTCGQDSDCNAAQVMAILGTMFGSEWIPVYWKDPIGDRLDTTVRGMKVLSIRDLARRTMEVAGKLVD